MAATQKLLIHNIAGLYKKVKSKLSRISNDIYHTGVQQTKSVQISVQGSVQMLSY
jgi:hypothetical protein